MKSNVGVQWGVLLFTLFDNEIMLINLAINLGTKTGLQIMQSNFSQKNIFNEN